jgi:hypothetical protein
LEIIVVMVAAAVGLFRQPKHRYIGDREPQERRSFRETMLTWMMGDTRDREPRGASPPVPDGSELPRYPQGGMAGHSDRQSAESFDGFSVGGSGPMYCYDPDAPAPPPLTEALSVFRRLRRPDDELPAELVHQLSRLDENAEGTEPDEQRELDLPLPYRLPLPGRGRRLERVRDDLARLRRSIEQHEKELGVAVVRESRLLVGPVGARRTRLFGIPTTTGHVSFFAIEEGAPGGSGSTAQVLDQGVTWRTSWRKEESGIHLLAYGLLSDAVAAIGLEVAGNRHLATVGENGFILETDGQAKDVGRFHIDYRDGTTAAIDAA